MQAIVKETTFKSISVAISRLNSLSHDIVGIASKFIGEDQRDEKAKTTQMFSVWWHFRFYCFVTTHKLNFEFMSQTGSATHESSRLFSRGNEKEVEIWA